MHSLDWQFFPQLEYGFLKIGEEGGGDVGNGKYWPDCCRRRLRTLQPLPSCWECVSLFAHMSCRTRGSGPAVATPNFHEWSWRAQQVIATKLELSFVNGPLFPFICGSHLGTTASHKLTDTADTTCSSHAGCNEMLRFATHFQLRLWYGWGSSNFWLRPLSRLLQWL